MRHPSLAILLLALPLAAQTRGTVLVGPPALGATFRVQHVLPAGSAGHLAGFLWSGPFAGAVPVPGFAVNGLIRVDPTGFSFFGLTVTDGVNLPSMAVTVPSSPSVLGSRLDCQSFDLDLEAVYQLAGNDVSVRVIDGPAATLNMVAIAPGTFAMGSPVTPLNVAPYFNQASAQPVHQVTISRPFWIGKYEVTQAQYQSVMGVNPSFFQGASYPNPAQLPVERVTWQDAVAYCAALTASERAAGRVPAGYVYRLPTEAEWEYCCRAGTTTEYHFGPTLGCGQANFSFNQHTNSLCPTSPGARTAVVGSYPPNAWGLHEMHGNVFEWCLDSWDLTANYPAGAVTDPLVTSGPNRMLRGGGWLGYSENCRSAYRTNGFPGSPNDYVGFRVVLAPMLGPVAPDPSLNMVAIAPGSFSMGSPVAPLNVAPYFNQANAQPAHPVTISRAFWIGKHEVTQAQYQALMGSNPSFFQGPAYPNAAQRPVEQVTWNQAVAYCAALTAAEQAAGRVPAGYAYRLPTEAEWEYCCRAGTTTEFHTGQALVCGQANFVYSWHGNSGCGSSQTTVVGAYAPNAWGLHDMHGNVWEWCQDGWDGTAGYSPTAATDPFVASGSMRIFRGGSWTLYSSLCRSPVRGGLTPAGIGGDIGFRVVLAPAVP